jgi:hypothetical protein
MLTLYDTLAGEESLYLPTSSIAIETSNRPRGYGLVYNQNLGGWTPEWEPA